MNPLALDTFSASTLYGSTAQNQQQFTGRVTCSFPFRMFAASGQIFVLLTSPLSITGTIDNRELVAIGCAEGVWIGLRSDPSCQYPEQSRVQLT